MSVKKGGIEYLGSLMLICLSGIMLLYGIAVKEIRLYQHMVKDSLDTSCLAATLADMDRYADERVLIMDDYYELRDIFCRNLICNMNLDNNYMPVYDAIFDRVKIHEFNVYYFYNGKMYAYTGSDNGTYDLNITTVTGNEKTPDGTPIESGTVYADIGMNVCTYFGIEEYVHVTSVSDIVAD